MIKIFAAILIACLTPSILFPQQGNVFFYQSLAWSPDGRTLISGAMSEYEEKTDKYKTGIYIIKFDGSNPQKISGDIIKPSYPVWSNDGTRIIFSASDKKDKNTNIFSVKKDGTGLIRLTNEPGQNTTPSFSPDGKKIAFMSTREGEKFQIYVMKRDGTKIQRLTTDTTVSFCNPVWSKDGKKIVYYSDKSDGKDQVWIMNADGSNQKMLTNSIGHNIFPDFSPDDKFVIFSSSNRSGENASYIDGSYLYMMNADGLKSAPLANIKSFFSRFSKDGKKIAFIAGSFPKSKIYIVNRDGSDLKSLTQ